ncbi:hypothetical protein ACFQ45_14110 [Rhodanobacter aciditrophus]|uniref:Uracil-DNA glycosylase-like domain-containing protein n=1 Tax=Rhodanobacter aciditrophus TaxID=1623218 RepID=A0ABW4B3X1_9GAMM
MPRELSYAQSFQTDCLEQLGVVSWFASSEPVVGVTFRPAQPWARADGLVADAPPVVVSEPDVSAFAPPEPVVPPKPVDPAEKDASVANLRQQLNAAPEVIVEDLQPIEEPSVHIDPMPEVVDAGLPTRVSMAGYWVAERLLLITDLPLSFDDEAALDKLALSLSKALLKQDIEAWQKANFIWPGKLKNRYLLNRQDWVLGAFEQFLTNYLKADAPLWVIIAGEQGAQFVEALPAGHPLKAYPTAHVHSLPQMLRIPELRKEAWQTMQSTFFNK